MDNNNKLKYLILFVLLITPSALALGVNAPYWKSNPLEMYPGQTKEISFVLVNSINEESDAKTFASLTKGTEIAKITSGSEYVVPPGANNKEITLQISIPESTAIGTNYDIELLIKSSPEANSGNVQLDIGYKVSFPVLIKDQNSIPEEKKFKAATPPQTIETQKQPQGLSFSTILIIVLVIIIAIIIFLIVKKRAK